MTITNTLLFRDTDASFMFCQNLLPNISVDVQGHLVEQNRMIRFVAFVPRSAIMGEVCILIGDYLVHSGSWILSIFNLKARKSVRRMD